jgi:positive regulator of sigma E activity
VALCAGAFAFLFYLLALALFLGSAMTGELFEVRTVVVLAVLLFMGTSALMAARTAVEEDRRWGRHDRD